MLKIQKRTVHRQITEEEMLKLKETTPFSGFRRDAKGVNFGFIFGMSHRTFASRNLQLNWTSDRVDAFIEERNLFDKKWEFAK